MRRQRFSAHRRRGVTLVEVMIALAILGIFGAAAVKLFAGQVRFVDQQQKARAARAVARQSYRLLVNELHLVEATGGVVAAAPSAVTLRVPYMIGMLCDTQAAGSTITMLPADAYGNAVPSGVAWRDALGTYSYDETPGRAVAPVDSSACVANGVGTPQGGQVVLVSPALASSVAVGSAVLLYQNVKYEFGPSALMPGHRALWRTPMTTNVGEELAAPFDTSAGFQFYGTSGDTSVASLPPASIRGLELSLTGSSERPRWGRMSPEIAPFRTSVFFGNRQ